MNRFRQRTVVIGGGVLALVILSLALGVLKDRILEQWYAWQLDSSEYEVRWSAAEKLERLRSDITREWYFSMLKSANERDREAARAKLAPASPPERILRFPEDRSLGRLLIQDFGLPLITGDVFYWTRLGEARGRVVIPADTDLCLIISEEGARDLSPLRQLPPDALYMLVTGGRVTDDQQLEHINTLTGLRNLSFYGPQTGMQITDNQLKHIAGLRSLWILDLTGTNITDQGLKHLEELASLRFVHISDTQVTRSGIDRLKKALPGCIPHHRNLYPWTPSEESSETFRRNRSRP